MQPTGYGYKVVKTSAAGRERDVQAAIREIEREGHTILNVETLPTVSQPSSPYDPSSYNQGGEVEVAIHYRKGA